MSKRTDEKYLEDFQKGFDKFFNKLLEKTDRASAIAFLEKQLSPEETSTLAGFLSTRQSSKTGKMVGLDKILHPISRMLAEISVALTELPNDVQSSGEMALALRKIVAVKLTELLKELQAPVADDMEDDFVVLEDEKHHSTLALKLYFCIKIDAVNNSIEASLETAEKIKQFKEAWTGNDFKNLKKSAAYVAMHRVLECLMVEREALGEGDITKQPLYPTYLAHYQSAVRMQYKLYVKYLDEAVKAAAPTKSAFLDFEIKNLLMNTPADHIVSELIRLKHSIHQNKNVVAKKYYGLLSEGLSFLEMSQVKKTKQPSPSRLFRSVYDKSHFTDLLHAIGCLVDARALYASAKTGKLNSQFKWIDANITLLLESNIVESLESMEKSLKSFKRTADMKAGGITWENIRDKAIERIQAGSGAIELPEDLQVVHASQPG